MLLNDERLKLVLPLTVGDWLVLESKGITLERLEQGSVKDVYAFVLYVAHKVDSSLTEADVQRVTRQELARYAETIIKAELREQNPTSPSSSIVSVQHTAGLSGT